MAESIIRINRSQNRGVEDPTGVFLRGVDSKLYHLYNLHKSTEDNLKPASHHIQGIYDWLIEMSSDDPSKTPEKILGVDDHTYFLYRRKIISEIDIAHPITFDLVHYTVGEKKGYVVVVYTTVCNDAGYYSIGQLFVSRRIEEKNDGGWDEYEVEGDSAYNFDPPGGEIKEFHTVTIYSSEGPFPDGGLRLRAA